MKEFYNTYLQLNLKDYLGDGYDVPIAMIILGLALGMILAAVILYFQKRALYQLAKQLMRHEATSEEKAQTLKELGLSSNKTVARMLLSGGQTKSMVNVLQAEENGENDTPGDEKTAKKIPGWLKFIYNPEERAKEKAQNERALKNRYYTDGDKLTKAQTIYESGAPTVVGTVVTVVIIATVAVVIVCFLPVILPWLYA